MSKFQCLLTFTALYVGLARSWDIALTAMGKLELYSNGTKTFTHYTQLRDLSALTYDAVHNMLLFADKSNDNASIFSFYIDTKKYEAVVRRSSYESINSLAFDPVKGLLFWTDTSTNSIFWNSLNPATRNETYGTLLFKMNDEIPSGIAVDSCRGYVYWTNKNVAKPTIERARLDGSEREVIVSTDIHMPVSIAVDQQTKRIYWLDDREGIPFTIESADLDGKHRTTLFVGTEHRPTALTVSKDSIYWLDLGYSTIWKLPKNATENSKAVEYIEFRNEVPFGIAANYPIEAQINGQECEALANISRNSTIINQTFNIPSDVGLFCVHGKKVDGRSLCNCTTGYTGERCEISRCQNYCLEGDCSFNTEGQPICRCKDGYSGPRCETNVCENYCLNNGRCSVNDLNKPICQCIGDYEGARCELLKVITTTTDAATTIAANETTTMAAPTTIAAKKTTSTDASTTIAANETTKPVCNCTIIQYSSELLYHTTSEIPTRNMTSSPTPLTSSHILDEIIPNCTQQWDSVRDPVIMALGILVGILCLMCFVLITKILKLKKRPRIKKRIIVNKNVTPLTARPDQCEITIENCCNMNICETPCFEPRSTIRPKLLDSKDGKEEKKNLISNMEYPDDPY